jgi:hypothetical protein
MYMKRLVVAQLDEVNKFLWLGHVVSGVSVDWIFSCVSPIRSTLSLQVTWDFVIFKCSIVVLQKPFEFELSVMNMHVELLGRRMELQFYNSRCKVGFSLCHIRTCCEWQVRPLFASYWKTEELSM